MSKYACAVIFLSHCFYGYGAEKEHIIRRNFKAPKGPHYKKAFNCIVEQKHKDALFYFRTAYKMKEHKEYPCLLFDYAAAYIKTLDDKSRPNTTTKKGKILKQLIIYRIDRAKQLIEEWEFHDVPLLKQKNIGKKDHNLSSEDIKKIRDDFWKLLYNLVNDYGVWKIFEKRYPEKFRTHRFAREWRLPMSKDYALAIELFRDGNPSDALQYFAKAYCNKEYEKNKGLRFDYAAAMLYVLDIPCPDENTKEGKESRQSITRLLERAKKLADEWEKEDMPLLKQKDIGEKYYNLWSVDVDCMNRALWDMLCDKIQQYRILTLEWEYNNEFDNIADEMHKKNLPIPYKCIAHITAQQNYIFGILQGKPDTSFAPPLQGSTKDEWRKKRMHHKKQKLH